MEMGSLCQFWQLSEPQIPVYWLFIMTTQAIQKQAWELGCMFQGQAASFALGQPFEDRLAKQL